MDRSSKPKAPSLSLIVPSVSNLPYSKQPAAVEQGSEQIRQLPPQTPSRSNAPAKQKRLFPVSCRLVPTDQWFTTRVDRTWQVLDLKVWLLSRALPNSVLPLPASYRPSSPVTFAAAPLPPPLRPPLSTFYQAPASSFERASSAPRYSPSTISPITFAAPPSILPLPSISSPPQSPQQLRVPQTSSPSLSPYHHHSNTPPSTPAEPLTHPRSFGPLVQEHEASPRLSLEQDDVPLYANPYGTILDDNLYDEDEDEDEVVRITSRSIPYSYNTGTPAISGLAALESNRNPSGRGYGGSSSSMDADLLKRATAIASRWQVYSFSTGMLLSDDLPMSEYNIRPHELLELHRASAYVSLPRTILPVPDTHTPSHTHDGSQNRHSSTKSVRAYHPMSSQRGSPSHMDARHAGSSDSSSDESDSVPVGSPYAQPYFDGWVWILREGVSASNGDPQMGPIDAGDTDPTQGRKMRRRSRAKSEASKSNKGKDRARMEREWKDLQQPLGKEGEVEAQLPESVDLWKKRWLIIREGFLTVWRERKDTLPEARYEISACAGLYGADRLHSATTAALPNIAPFADPLFTNPASSQAFMSNSSMSGSSLAHSPLVICARFRQGSSHSNKYPGRKGGKSSRKSQQRTGVYLVLKLADETTHEHLLRIFHRLAYSTPVSSLRRRPSVSSSSVTRPRTLRTDFLPNPIPHPLSLSFSAPSPVEHSDGSPVWPFDGLAPSDASEYEDGWIDADFARGRSRQRAPGKGIARYVGLGRGISVRFPEWREGIIRKATHASLGMNDPEPWGRATLSPEEETPRGDQLDMYGFVREDVERYTAALVREYEDSDDQDSDAFSEAEWEGWAYDLDRPKAVEEIGTWHGPTRKFLPSGLHTPHGSPVSDDPQLPAISSPPSTVASSSSTNALRPRSLSVDGDSPVQSIVLPPPQSPTSPSPTTLGARGRASTISAHPRNSTGIVAEGHNRPPSHFTTSVTSQMDPLPRSDDTTARAVEPNTTGGVRSLMRGLNRRVGKESFLRGLENALDFVEGK